MNVQLRVYLAEFGLGAAVLLDQMLQLVVDVLLSAAHLLQRLPDVLLQLVQVTLQRRRRVTSCLVSLHELILFSSFSRTETVLRTFVSVVNGRFAEHGNICFFFLCDLVYLIKAG